MADVLSFEKYKRQNISDQMLKKMMSDPKIQKELNDTYNFNHSNKYKLFLASLFYQNHKVMSDKNQNAGFLIGFDQNYLEYILSNVKSALDAMGRDYIIIEANNKTFIDCIKILTGKKHRSNYAASNELKDVLLNTDKVIIFKEFSKCIARFNRSKRIRTITKKNDDAHLDKIQPLSDLVFIDYAEFLQKSWSTIGTYIKVGL